MATASKPTPKRRQMVYNCQPTAAMFHRSKALVRGIRGPIGSGKSVACCIELGVYLAQTQEPDSHGVRRTRFAVVRNTYPELKTTTVQTWEQWWPGQVCKMTYSSPIVGNLRYKCPDGTSVDCEVWFVSLDKPKDVRKLLSMELTGAWINEAREIDISIVQAVLSRCGRYPSSTVAPLTWRGVIMDTNPPDDDHWWYRLAEEETPDGWEVYKQPPALIKNQETGQWEPNPAAENISNLSLGYGYYLQNVRPGNDEWIKVYCCGEYGFVQDGRPVYPEYSDSLHYTGGIIPYEPRLPLLIGMDFGLTPAAVIGQYYPGPHRLAALREVVSTNTGLDAFLDHALLPILAKEFGQTRESLSSIHLVGDPAGNIRAQTDESTCYDSLRARGFDPEEAATNDLLPRIDAVKRFLSSLSGGRPCLMLSSQVPVLRKGLAGKYRYARVQVAGEERYKDQPIKDSYSLPQDAFQYLSMLADGGINPKPATTNTVPDHARADAGRM